jgi:hypothetical protein
MKRLKCERRWIVTESSTQSSKLELDLAEVTLSDLRNIDFTQVAELVLQLPLPSVGRTNMHSDICSDLIDAAWAAEKLAGASGTAEISNDYIAKEHRSTFRLVLTQPHPDIHAALEEAILLFGYGDEDEERYKAVREAVSEFEENIDDLVPVFPEIIDDYYANLVNGAYSEARSEAPDYYASEIAKHPERQVGYHKSSYSHRLGGTGFVAMLGWALPITVEPDHFFEVTDQRYRVSDFIPGKIFTVASHAFVGTEEIIAYFPMNQYFKSRVCASLALHDDEDAWPFDWSKAAFTHSPFFHEDLPPLTANEHLAEEQRKEGCLIHPSGTLVIVNDGQFRHFLYDAKPLNPVAIKRIHQELASLTTSVSSLAGLSSSPLCEWHRLSDEQFEQLCYDVIFSHPKFDTDTIRKLGKSRSRDGGRDIEVYELPLQRSSRAKKWLFQCKLITDGSSLSARRLQDVGDMLEIYGAEGFGVMTSAPIDATLYDKLDAICGKRGVSQLNFSRHELERALVRLPAVRKRYFG